MTDRTLNDVHLQLTAGGWGSKVWIDGREVFGIRSVEVSCGVDRMTALRLEILCNADIQLQADALRLPAKLNAPRPDLSEAS